MAEDYYTLLKVRRDAPVQEIQDALRVEVMKWSRRVNNAPRAADRHEAEQRVELLGKVKKTLTDPVSRERYDQTLAFHQLPPPTPPPKPDERVRQPKITPAERGRVSRHPFWVFFGSWIAVGAAGIVASVASGNYGPGFVAVVWGMIPALFIAILAYNWPRQ